jgi:hypothetical protein
MSSNKFINNASKLPIYKPPSLVDNIITKVKEKSSKDLKIYLAVAIPILILLIYLVYKYRLSSRTTNIISSLDYTSNVTSNITLLPQCYQLDIKEQYKLCDYYISSSFMTPCIGNQHYDYVSNDMITSVIQSGARYIQIPICQSDVAYESLPVVGTAEYGQQLITSLNTIDLKSTLKTIRGNAFKINNKDNNYPLIIHLILNTNNPYTLGVVADTIQEVLSDVLVTVSKYTTFPIFLEKLCNLLGKIIIFATPEYINTSLEPYIVPTSKLFELYHFSELGALSMTTDTVFKNSYNQKLSTKEQTASNLRFKANYPSIDYIVQNSDTVGDTILADKTILDNLTCFNKVGMTVVKPQFPTDVISKNYDITESIFLGCQFTTMNFQINDVNLKEYLKIFNNSSFRLKPASMRFTEDEKPIVDLLPLYQSILKKNNNIINSFYYTYNNLLLSFESYTVPNTFMTQIETNLRIKVGSNQTQDTNGKITYNTGIEQCFIARKSKIGSSTNVSIYLESAAIPGYFITLNGNAFILQTLYKTSKELNNQSFYVEIGKIIDKEVDNPLYSIRTVSNDTPLYIAFENKLVKSYADSPQIEAHNNMSFFINTVKFKTIINILTLYDDTLKTMPGNLIGVLENNTTDGTSYYMEPTSNSTSVNKNFDIFKDQFTLQNKNTKTYVSYDSTSQFLYDRDMKPTLNSIFSITPASGYYTILNTNGDNLILFNRNLIKFAKSADTKTNENLFKLNITYELI